VQRVPACTAGWVELVSGKQEAAARVERGRLTRVGGRSHEPYTHVARLSTCAVTAQAWRVALPFARSRPRTWPEQIRWTAELSMGLMIVSAILTAPRLPLAPTPLPGEDLCQRSNSVSDGAGLRRPDPRHHTRAGVVTFPRAATPPLCP